MMDLATRTVRKDRIDKPPLHSDEIMKKKERGAFDYRSDSKGNIVCKWYDNSVVTVASSGAGINPIGLVNRYSQKEKKKENTGSTAKHDKILQPIYGRCRQS